MGYGTGVQRHWGECGAECWEERKREGGSAEFGAKGGPLMLVDMLMIKYMCVDMLCVLPLSLPLVQLRKAGRYTLTELSLSGKKAHSQC